MRDLNVLLSVQLAQSTDIPPQFKRYKIANGRATFTVANAFEVDVGIADDTLDGPFFFIDFRLLFGDRKNCLPKREACWSVQETRPWPREASRRCILS